MLPLTKSGNVCLGQHVVLSWPDPSEFDALTRLRNQPWARTRFLSQDVLSVAESRKWLEMQLANESEGLLAIKWLHGNLLLGTIGWTDWDRSKGTACFGRLIVDRDALRELMPRFEPGYPGVAVDAALALRDYAFETMHLRSYTTWYIKGNDGASRVNRAIGMVITGEATRIASDGRAVETIELSMTKEHWMRLRAGV